MNIGLKHNTVELAEHSLEWEKIAAETIKKLWHIFGTAAKDIQHVGSTAIQAIKAKPIIDIAVAVDDFSSVIDLEPKLKAAGFLRRNWADDSQLLFAIGDYEKPDGIVTHFIHVVKAESASWCNYIIFRDYLNANLKVAKQYEALKVRLAAENPYDKKREKYLNGKQGFIEEILREAKPDKDLTIFLVRHGKDDETVRGGWSNSELIDEGHLQARKLADYILDHKCELKIEKLYSSDLPRAIQTVMPLSVALNIEVEYVPDFREINNGILAGMPNAITKEKFPDLFYSTLEWNESYPQGESPREFYERIKTTWEQFSKAIARSGKNAILVRHGGVISVIYSLIDGMPYSNKVKTQQVAFATLLPIKYNNGVWQKV